MPSAEKDKLWIQTESKRMFEGFCFFFGRRGKFCTGSWQPTRLLLHGLCLDGPPLCLSDAVLQRCLFSAEELWCSLSRLLLLQKSLLVTVKEHTVSYFKFEHYSECFLFSLDLFLNMPPSQTPTESFLDLMSFLCVQCTVGVNKDRLSVPF